MHAVHRQPVFSSQPLVIGAAVVKSPKLPNAAACISSRKATIADIGARFSCVLTFHAARLTAIKTLQIRIGNWSPKAVSRAKSVPISTGYIKNYVRSLTSLALNV